MFAVMSLEVFISSERTRQNTCVIPYSPKTININNMFIRSYRNEGTQPINLYSSICNINTALAAKPDFVKLFSKRKHCAQIISSCIVSIVDGFDPP